MLGAGGISFESHLDRVNNPARRILVELRDFVRSLGPNVIEDIRPHRIVYAKTMNFRIFLDIEPAGDSLVLSVRQGRAGPASRITLKTPEELDAAKSQITTAFEKIQ